MQIEELRSRNGDQRLLYAVPYHGCETSPALHDYTAFRSLQASLPAAWTLATSLDTSRHRTRLDRQSFRFVLSSHTSSWREKKRTIELSQPSASYRKIPRWRNPSPSCSRPVILRHSRTRMPPNARNGTAARRMFR